MFNDQFSGPGRELCTACVCVGVSMVAFKLLNRSTAGAHWVYYPDSTSEPIGYKSVEILNINCTAIHF